MIRQIDFKHHIAAGIIKHYLVGQRTASMATSYTIGNHDETLIKNLVDSGRCSTASEVMRDGLRLIEESSAR